MGSKTLTELTRNVFISYHFIQTLIPHRINYPKQYKGRIIVSVYKYVCIVFLPSENVRVSCAQSLSCVIESNWNKSGFRYLNLPHMSSVFNKP